MNSYRYRSPLTSATLRARRRRRARIILGLFALALMALVGFALYAVRSSHTRLTNIQVVGADANTDAAIGAYVRGQLAGSQYRFIPADSILFFSGSALADKVLRSFPRLASADVRLASLSGLMITVSERLPKALWCPDLTIDPGQCLTLDATGAAYGTDSATGTAPFVRYYGALDRSQVPPQFLPPAQFRALTAFVDGLSRAGAGPVESAAINAEGDVTLQFESGLETLVTLPDVTQQGGDVLERFSLALSSAPFQEHKLGDFEYLDLRFGDKLYYKLKSGESISSSTAKH